ncbi:MAG: hypothetical protein ABH851_08820 [Methanobacteriota archaeon]
MSSTRQNIIQLTCIIIILSISNFASAQMLDLDGFRQEFKLQFEVPLDDSGNITVQPILYIVYGSDMDLVERSIMDMFQTGMMGTTAEAYVESGGDLDVEVSEIEIIYLDDSPESFKQILLMPGAVFLLGGPGHNNLTELFLANASETDEESIYYGQLNLTSGSANNMGFSVFEHPRSRNKLVRESAKTSPLRRFFPEEYVPLAAMASGLGLMWLLSLLQTVFEFMALHYGRKKRKIRETHRMIGPIKIDEVAAILGASFVLGLSITFTFFGITPVFLTKLLQNWVLCLFAALSHEVSHRMVGKLCNIHIEYHFWWEGSAITLLTGYLGHPFSIQGFLMEKIEGPVTKWKYGLTKLAAPLFSFAIMMSFAYLNYKNPSEVYQIITVTSSLWAAAEIMPFSHLDGKDVRAWNHTAWFLSFMTIMAGYMIVNFLL